MVTNLRGDEVTHDLIDFPLAFYEVKKKETSWSKLHLYIKELRIIWSLAIFSGGIITDIYVNRTIHFCKNGLKYIVFCPLDECSSSFHESYS